MAAAKRKKLKIMMASLRSEGFTDGFLSSRGSSPGRSRPKVGMMTPATCGSKYDSNSWRPRKYQGAFDGLGCSLKLANSSSGASTNDREDDESGEDDHQSYELDSEQMGPDVHFVGR